jgi:hypothetical protein
MLSRFTLFPIKCNFVALCKRSDYMFRSTFPTIQFPSPSTTKESNETTNTGFNNASNMITIRYLKTLSWRKRSILIKNRLRQAASRYKKPGQIQAVSMPLSPQEMDNTMLVVLSQMGKSLYADPTIG